MLKLEIEQRFQLDSAWIGRFPVPSENRTYFCALSGVFWRAIWHDSEPEQAASLLMSTAAGALSTC
jgi:hypothetical protein